jgi:hypothetical protein
MMLTYARGHQVCDKSDRCCCQFVLMIHFPSDDPFCIGPFEDRQSAENYAVKLNERHKKTYAHRMPFIVLDQIQSPSTIIFDE